MSNWDYEENKGKIKRLYPTLDYTYFTLSGTHSAMKPTDGYYKIPTTHPNYLSLVNLLYLCAEHHWVVKVRTKEELVLNHAEVIYLVVDF